MSPDLKSKTYYGNQVNQISESLTRKELPEGILLTETNGVEKYLNQIVDSVTYIDNWASWCGPCVREMPKIINLYLEVKDKSPVKFIAVSSDVDENNWKKASVKLAIPFGNYKATSVDIYEKYSQYYKIPFIPYGILLDQNGAIIKSGINDAEALKAELTKLGYYKS